MAERIIVNKPVLWPYGLLGVFGVVLGGVGVLVAVMTKQFVWLSILGSAGLLCVGLAIVRGKREAAKELAVEVHEHSFLVEGAAGERTIRDDEVLCMSVIDTKKYSSGLLKAVERRFIVWLAADGPPEPLELCTRTKLGDTDSLTPLVDRIAERLCTAAGSDLAGGRRALGEHWHMDARTLVMRPPAEPAVEIPVGDITACEYIDGNVCVWRKGQDEAAARISLGTANAYLLGMLLGRILQERPKTDEAGPPAEGLGRVIFERKPKPSTIGALFVFFVLCDLIGLLLVVAGFVAGEIVAVLVGAGLWVIAVGLLFGWLHARRAAFRCHEWGVYQRGLGSERQLRYTDVGSFTYGATRHFYNGAYTGTSLSMVFKPLEKDAQPISYSATLRHLDDELENLREHVAKVVAVRLYKRFKAGEPITWTKNLRLVQEGLEHRPTGFLGRKDPVLHRFEDITNFDIQEGFLHVWIKGKEKSVVQEACSEANFYPGFFLMVTAYQDRHGNQTPSRSGDEEAADDQ
jgi:hypothetical protein